MVNRTSGRVAGVHEGIFCDVCKQPIGYNVRFKCLQCSDYDVCGVCENNENNFQNHFAGTHLFMKLRNSNMYPREFISSFVKVNANPSGFNIFNNGTNNLYNNSGFNNNSYNNSGFNNNCFGGNNNVAR